jgi:hypothetical protein
LRAVKDMRMCSAATISPAPTPAATPPRSASCHEGANPSSSMPAITHSSPPPVSVRVSRLCSLTATLADAVIEPTKNTESTMPAVSSDTPRSAAMNSSAGPNAEA